MALQYRTEQPKDFAEVAQLIEAAFATEVHSDHREHHLVARLRLSPAFIPKLSIVAELEGQILGHILLTKAHIQNEQQKIETLALAPVSVLPEAQNKGIGRSLIREAHQRATVLGFASIVLLGHADYYPRLGYVPASRYKVSFPFDAPDENCMIVALQANSLDGICGKVVYPAAFYE